MNSTDLKPLRLASAALAVCFVVLTVASSTSRGALVEYSWKGTIEPLDVNEDPWGIGAGLVFVITGVVDETALDLDDDVGDARFDLFDAQLLIDGVAPESIGDGSISFRESSSDDISITLQDVIFRGTRERFFVSARLPTSTFAFEEIAESPPIFLPTTMSITGGTVSGQSSYRTITYAGDIVTATSIPEPSTFALILLALLGPTIFFWRSCTRLCTI